jgi:serine protease AprX
MWRKVICGSGVIALLLGNKATATQYAFQVTFSDKNNTPYSLSSPLDYLSPRALARRTQQSIAVDSTDLPVDPAYLDSVLTLTGGKMHTVSRWLNLCVVLLTDSTQIHNLDSKPYITSTKLVGYYSGILHKPANTTSGVPYIAPKNTAAGAAFYGDTWFQTSLVNGNVLHDMGFNGAGKLIAVIDEGFAGVDTHPGFDSMITSGRLADVHNFTLNTNNVYGYGAHGTKVLSTMAGYVPNTFVGSAPLAAYALYITEDGNSEQPVELTNMVAAIERADSLGADIVTTSLGYNTFDNFSDNLIFATELNGRSTSVAKAANMATHKGILFVATAGNEGTNTWHMILTPGDADSALTIGSVDATGAAWYSSGYGPNSSGQVKPDVCAYGHNANIFSLGGYTAEDGTSFSTPQIAGWAACLWEANPGATPAHVRQAIIKCASSYSAPDPHLGYGIPNFQCTEQLLDVTDLHSIFADSHWVIAGPDPFTDNLNLYVSPAATDYVNFTITDMSGRAVSAFQLYALKGNNTAVSISLPGLPAGIYMLRAVSPTQQQVLRLIRQ